MTMAPSHVHRSGLPLLAFALETHPPALYITVSVLWSYSVLCMLLGQNGQAGPLDWTSVGVSLAFFLILLFLRAVDEIKDLDYDRQHNSHRPLVRGAVSVAQVWRLAGLVAGAVLALSAVMSMQLTAWAALQMGYGIGLLALERRLLGFRNALVLNLVLTFPVSAALNVYAYLYLSVQHMAPALSAAVPVIAAHVCIFLHLEFGRKLKWPHLAAPNENGYAQVLGLGGAITVCALLGGIACGLAAWMHLRAGAGWLAALPTVAMLPSIAALRIMQTVRHEHRDLKPYFGAAMLSFFFINVLIAVCGR